MFAAAGGWAGGALAHPEFGSSVNPITTRGADYAHYITASPPGFENQRQLCYCHFLKTSIFEPLCFLKWCPIFDGPCEHL